MRKTRRGDIRFKISSRRKDVGKSKQFKSLFHRDLAAMKQVWAMLRQGTIRAFGEIGRQY